MQADILAALKRFREIRVLVVGDVIADHYRFGLPTRLSREAPVLVLEQISESTVPGGAANAAANARALGGRVDLVGVVGEDRAADLLLGQLQVLRVATEGIVASRERPTTTKTRIFAGAKPPGQQVVRFDRVVREPLSRAHERALMAAAATALAKADVLLLSDYAYGAIPSIVARKLLSMATRAGVPSVVDSQGNLSIFRGATILTPNLAELEAWAGTRLVTSPEVEAAATKLRKATAAEFVLCTRGGDGMTLVGPTRCWELPVARRAEVFDVAGAGDTVAATVALGLGAGLAPIRAALIADCAASVVVQKLGAAVCSPAELRSAIRKMDPTAAAAAAPASRRA